MADSVYKVIALVGSSTDSWEKAAAAAIGKASKTLRDLRVARVIEQDVHVEGGKLDISREARAVLQVRRRRLIHRPGGVLRASRIRHRWAHGAGRDQGALPAAPWLLPIAEGGRSGSRGPIECGSGSRRSVSRLESPLVSAGALPAHG